MHQVFSAYLEAYESGGENAFYATLSKDYPTLLYKSKSLGNILSLSKGMTYILGKVLLIQQ